ncbi:MAG: hypothetical protein LRY31_03760 [Burkholderiaceae bacterium]|nr:hypothetical protein [Burkholderiaceae bacterium]
MRALQPQKLLILIAPRNLQRLLIDTAKRCGIGGYTAVQATGAGDSGLQSGFLDCDSNVMIHIILSEAMLETLLPEIDELMDTGYPVKVMVSDVAVLPRKGSHRV